MSMPVYRGRVRQRGFGLGGTLKKFDSNIIPYLVDNMASTLINEVTGGVQDAIKAPKTYKRIVKKRGKTIAKHVASTLMKGFNDNKLLSALTGTKSIKGISNIDKGQSGSGHRKRCNKNKRFKHSKKRRLDYFDQS